MFQQIIRLQRDIAESIELFSDFFAWSNFYSFQVPDLKKITFNWTGTDVCFNSVNYHSRC